MEKKKLAKEIKAAWLDLRYQEDNSGMQDKDTIWARAYYDGLVTAWKIIYDEEVAV